jgi:hypothetical protein
MMLLPLLVRKSRGPELDYVQIARTGATGEWTLMADKNVCATHI